MVLSPDERKRLAMLPCGSCGSRARSKMRREVMEETKMKKRKNNAQNIAENHDYLTGLPEPLLHHILSYLRMTDVIRTSVLAKRWRYVWLYAPCLNFSPLKLPTDKEVGFISRSLILHKGPAIQKLNINCNYFKQEAHHVDSWIHFAITRNVNEICLDFLFRDRFVGYKVPHFIFSCGSLAVLELRNCVIEFPDKFKLSSLKCFSLELVDFSGGAINDLISSCPVLECLSLSKCDWKDNLDLSIINASVKTLKIHQIGNKVEVYAPFIVSFELITSLSGKNFVIKGMQSLESATFGCRDIHACCGQVTAEDKGFSILETLDDVCHVKDLRLCSCYVQALSSRDILSFGATCLRIETGLTKWELPGITYILTRSPNVETLVIIINEIEDKKKSRTKKEIEDKMLDYNVQHGEYWIQQEPDFINLLGNLKTVKIQNFMKNLNVCKTNRLTTEEFLENLQNDLKFLRFLLKNAKVLERMIITTCKEINFGRRAENKKLNLLLQLTQKLLGFPRASRDAQISFY